MARDRPHPGAQRLGAGGPAGVGRAGGRLLPRYRPGSGQLPPSLRAVHGDELGFHFTEPELAEQIVRTNRHLPTRLGAGRHGVYVTRHGPHTDDAAMLLERLFLGRLDSAPKLWAALIYRTAPTAATGLPIVPDLTLAVGWGHYHPCAASGLAYVADFLLAWGLAGPPQTGATWHWVEP